MTDKINTLQTIKARPTDQWTEAYALLVQSNPITAIETRICVDDMFNKFPQVVHSEDDVINTSGYSIRNVKLLDRDKRVVYVCKDVVVDGKKLYFREGFQPIYHTSWYNFFFSRFRRAPKAPKMNINIIR